MEEDKKKKQQKKPLIQSISHHQTFMGIWCDMLSNGTGSQEFIYAVSAVGSSTVSVEVYILLKFRFRN